MKEKFKKFKELWKDKRERAKIELVLYGIFFIGVIIFVRILGSMNSNNQEREIPQSFLLEITDNYEYKIDVTYNDKNYFYQGKSLGNNMSINLMIDGEEISYYKMDNKYYILKDGNYLLTEQSEIYPYLEYRYLNLENIKNYLKYGTKEDNKYFVKLSDLILNCDSEDSIMITTNEENKRVEIDYTNFFKYQDDSISEVIVNYTFSNIDKIISLEDKNDSNVE